MDREKLKILAAFGAIGLLVLIVPGLRLFSGDTPTADPVEGFAPMPLNPVGQFRGVWLQVHNNDPGCPFEQYIEEIASTGANTVCLAVSGEQENGKSNTIYVDLRRAPSEPRLIGMIKLAKRLGMRVVFMPIVLLTDPVGGEWRGEINPADWSKWWAGYGDFVLRYAAICQREGVDGFIIGSELLTTERQEDRWRDLIGRIRRQGSDIVDRQFRDHLREIHPAWTAADFRRNLGVKSIDTLAASQLDLATAPELAALYRPFANSRRMLLSYSANWDHYTVPKFWDALDAVGMTTYHDLNTFRSTDPSLESLLAAWAPIKADIVRWRRKIRKPIFFTEVGWPSQDGCSYEPWNYYRSRTVDLAEQQRCTASFLQTFGSEPWVGGVLIWKWRDHPGMTGAGDDNDAGRLNYTPFGKPVMKTLQTFFASPNPAASAGAGGIAERTEAAPLAIPEGLADDN